MMEKKMRVDKRKNIEKIAKVVVKNPRLTQREIAKKTGLAKTTVQQNLLDLKMSKDDRIITLTDVDFDIVKLAQQRIREKLEDEELMKKTSIEKISSVAKDSSARYSLFRGTATDKDGGLSAKVVGLPDLLD